MLAAARRNARHSTGPRSPAGKRNSKLNALKHGAYASFENQRESMQALGEDPEKFEALREELRSAFAPSDAFFERQIEDLAWLYWRRERLERMLTALRRRALQGIEEWQHRRRREMAGVTFDASRHELVDWNLPVSDGRGVKLRLRLSYLGVIREQVKQGLYRPRQQAVLESVYRGEMGWRSQLIYALVWRFCQAEEQERERANQPDHLRDFVDSDEVQAPGEAEQQELLRLLEEEIASVEEELAHEEKANEERVAIEREACLAPQGEAWNTLVRQEGALDRSIDRKVRILLGLRKESAGLAGAPAGGGGGTQRESIEAATDGVPENEELVEAASNIKLKERSGNVDENKAPGFERTEGPGEGSFPRPAERAECWQAGARTTQMANRSRYILHLLRSPVGYVHLNADAARALTQAFCRGRAALC
jgi:hypothetical protein